MRILSDVIKIPVLSANHEFLAYYHAKLYKQGDPILFESHCSLPVTVMDIGKNYIDAYIMNKNYANGVYLEYHDLPHFHMPLNKSSTGYLILGKFIGRKLRLTAFTIPYGYSIYTSPYTIHNDCFLIGKYIVVYSLTNNYSTFRLLNNDGNCVKFEFY